MGLASVILIVPLIKIGEHKRFASLICKPLIWYHLN